MFVLLLLLLLYDYNCISGLGNVRSHADKTVRYRDVSLAGGASIKTTDPTDATGPTGTDALHTGRITFHVIACYLSN